MTYLKDLKCKVFVKTKGSKTWKKVGKVNLGSCKKPNKNIVMVRIVEDSN